MATNPMQRKARNSFLLGMLLTTVILGLIIAGLVYMMMNMKNVQDELQAATVYVINKDITSGGEVTAADLTQIKVSKDAAPSNAASTATINQAISASGESDSNEESEPKNVVAKIDMKKGTIVTTDMLSLEDTAGKDVRKQEYNMVVLPMDLTNGEYIDVRLLLPNGQDFIVVSKKKVEIPMIAGIDSTDTISIEVSEDEILSMSNAIVEAFMINGSKLYATRYTDAGNQDQATPTYPVNSEVRNLMNSDPNILDKAKSGLAARFNTDGSKNLRENYINASINAQEDSVENEQDKMKESITNSQTSRQQYLQSMTTTTTTTTTTTDSSTSTNTTK